jgi:hypothetical protein
MMDDHLERVIGRAPWGMSGPKYQLENGIAVYQGPFFPEWVNRLSYTAENYLQIERPVVSYLLGYQQAVTESHLELFRQVIKKIAALVKERYGSDLSVIFFAKGRAPREGMSAKLHAPGIPTLYFEDWATERVPIDKVMQKYYLLDKVHINALGHHLVAEKLLKNDLATW